MSRLMHNIIGALGVSMAVVGAVYPAPILAQDEAAMGSAYGDRGVPPRRISMGVGKTIIVDLPREASEIVVGNPKVANAIVRSSRKLYIMGEDAGQTTIFALDSAGRQIANLEISIGRDVGELAPLLKLALPKSEIVARTVNDTIILTGSVSSAGEAQRAVDIAKGFASKAAAVKGVGGGSGGGDDGRVINALSIRGEEQVMLKVTVAEIERKIVKQLGFSAQAGGQTILKGGWGSLLQENPFGINPTLSNTALNINGPNSTSATLKAMERYGVARLLAEPTATAVSGESAKMIVGGEIGVPGGSSCIVFQGGGSQPVCTPSVTFKPYGISLNFTPIVLTEGRIQLHLATEVTEIDLQNSFSYNSVSIPGFKTRKSESTVELPSGGSIATAGLLTQTSAQAITGLPGLINLPILGALFRSRDFQRNETELLIIVTPYIAKAMSAQDVSRPDDGFSEASDPQGWLLGRVNRLYSSPSNPQIVKNFKGRIGFIHD